MYVVIVGAGEVGSYVARILVGEGHDVAVIETDEDLARRLDASLNALVVHGSGVNPEVLQRAGLERADLLLAVTSTDEVNLIACMTARKYGTRKLRAVARVRQSRAVAGDLALSAEDLGLDALISPEQAIATAILEVLRYTGSGEMHELAAGKLALVGMALAPDSPLLHETLEQLRGEYPDFVVVAVQGRHGRIPTGADRLQVDDRAFVLTLPQNVTELAILSGTPWYHVQRILIVGCGNTGLAVARELDRREHPPTIIEQDPDRAEYLASLLPRSLILNGDGSDPDFLRSRIEEGRIDAVLVLVKEPEDSVLMGIFAKSLGARKVIVRCDKPAYAQLATKHGVDAVISPKRAMTDAILRYARSGKVELTLQLGPQEAEVISFKVPGKPARSDLFRKPIRDLGLPEGALVAAVIRGDNVLLGSGAVLLQPADELFVVARQEALARVDKLLS